MKTTVAAEKVSSHPGEKRALEPQKASEHPRCQRKTEDGLGKRLANLANLWRRNILKKKAHAGRGPEIKWEMSADR